MTKTATPRERNRAAFTQLNDTPAFDVDLTDAAEGRVLLLTAIAPVNEPVHRRRAHAARARNICRARPTRRVRTPASPARPAAPRTNRPPAR